MINANEQRIIDVAQGTFEYQGELYTVRPAYLNILQKKMDDKDVELTSDQADQAIQQIYGNIERGVREGILKKVTGEDAEEAREQGKVRSLDEIGLTGDGAADKEESSKASNTAEPEMVTGKDGESYPVQQKPLRMDELESFHLDDIEAVQTYTANEQVASQLNAGLGQTVLTMLVSWLVCILVLSVYLKMFKHRRKAFFAMLGASLAGLALLVLGSIYVYDLRACSADTWQTVALESGYFKECTKSAQEELQKVLSGVELEAGVEILGLDDDVVYRDAKSIFAARLNGKGIPKLEKREEEMQEALRLVLPREAVENVEAVSKVLIEHYRKVLDTPYASYLYEIRQKEEVRDLVIAIVSVLVLLLALVFIWRGSKYIHRRFRKLSYGIGMAGVSFVIAGVADRIITKSVCIEPKIYQTLFEHYLLWCSENILYFGILLLCISIFTWSAAYVTKKNHIEKLGFK